MTDKLIVFVTCENRSQAERIAQTAVEHKLAACVNVLPAVRSRYVWEGKLAWAEEVLLLVKTTSSRVGQWRDQILDLHSYEVPEIVAVQIENGLTAYLDWIEKSVVR